MTFHALNIHHYVNPGHPLNGRLSDQDRETLKKALDAIEDKAHRLRKVKDQSRLPKNLEDDYRVLRGTLSLQAPRVVCQLEQGWYEELQRCVAHDRQVLAHSSNGAPKRKPVDQLRQACDQESCYSIEWRQEQLGPFPLLSADLVRRYQQLAAEASHDGWSAHLATWVRRQFRTRQLRGLSLLSVDVRQQAADRGLPWRDAVARAEAFPPKQPESDRTVWKVLVRVPITGAERVLEVELFLEFVGGGGSRRFLLAKRRGGARGKAIWDLLTGGLRGDRGLLPRIAAALARLGRTPRHRSWADVLRDAMAAGTPHAPAVSVCLLAELADHCESQAALASNDLTKLFDSLPHIASAAGWQSLIEHLSIVAAPLLAARHDPARLHAAAVREAPSCAEPDDLDWLLDLARQWRLDLGAAGLVAAALATWGRQHTLTPDVGELRQLLCQRPPVLTYEALQPVWQLLTARLSELDGKALPDIIRSVSSVLGAAQQAKVADDRLAGFCEASLCPVLLDQLPNPELGVWQTTDQQESCLRGLAAFEELVSALHLSNRYPPLLETARQILPRLPGTAGAARYPSTYWGLVESWLRRQTPNWERYALEVAECLVRRYLAADAAQTALLGLLEEQLSRLGDWLRQQRVAAGVSALLAGEIVNQLAGAGANPARAGRAVQLLSPLDANDALCQAAVALLTAAPWSLGLADPLRRFLAGVMRPSDREPRAELQRDQARLLVSGLLRAGSGQTAIWSDLLVKWIPPHGVAGREAAEEALVEWDCRLECGAPLAALQEQLHALAGWLGGASGPGLYSRWSAWIPTYGKTLAVSGAPNPFSERTQLALLSACLRKEPNLAQARLRLLWPALPSHLLVYEQFPALGAWLGLLQATGLTMTDAMEQSLAAHVSPGLTSGLAASDGPERVLRILQAWTQLLPGRAGPRNALQALWPVLPSGLLLRRQVTQVDLFCQVCRDSGFAFSEPLLRSLAAAVLDAVLPLKANELETLTLLAAFVGDQRQGLWDQLVPLARQAGGLSRDSLLALALAIFGSPLDWSQHLFQEEAWRQAGALRGTNPKLARQLAALAC